MLSRYGNLMNLVEAGYISIKEKMDLDDNRFFERWFSIYPVGKIQIGISVIATADGPISTYQALWTAISAHY